jgi:hypothetical protein
MVYISSVKGVIPFLGGNWLCRVLRSYFACGSSLRGLEQTEARPCGFKEVHLSITDDKLPVYLRAKRSTPFKMRSFLKFITLNFNVFL